MEKSSIEKRSRGKTRELDSLLNEWFIINVERGGFFYICSINISINRKVRQGEHSSNSSKGITLLGTTGVFPSLSKHLRE